MEIRIEFEKRKTEIELYLEILKTANFDKAKLTGYDSVEGKNIDLLFDGEKIKILTANSFLLIYNLVESTIYNSIVSIFDAITDNGVKYFEMIQEVQKYWLNNLYKHDVNKKKETIIDTFMNIAVQIFENTISLASNEINYGGSLDAQTIFETAKSMRIEVANIHKMYDKNLHGSFLVDIKKKRNWLAHGEKTFSEVGTNVSYSEIEAAKNAVIIFLEEYINSVEAYINNQKYKAAIPAIAV
ncbi:MAG: MAE_28990/MAE_18760 family HEPN-like nuclease [Ferruginibacter sp.]